MQTTSVMWVKEGLPCREGAYSSMLHPMHSVCASHALRISQDITSPSVSVWQPEGLQDCEG